MDIDQQEWMACFFRAGRITEEEQERYSQEERESRLDSLSTRRAPLMNAGARAQDVNGECSPRSMLTCEGCTVSSKPRTRSQH